MVVSSGWSEHWSAESPVGMVTQTSCFKADLFTGHWLLQKKLSHLWS